jgi:PAS domain S-box-containing protein
MSSVIDVFLDDLPTALEAETESAELLRLVQLIEQIFHVPIAYMALFGPNLRVVARIGDGTERAAHFRHVWPLALAATTPLVFPERSDFLPERFDPGEIRFACSVPLRSINDVVLGALVIADVQPRPDFSSAGLGILSELAWVLSGKMELGSLAAEARERELSLLEAEARFRNIANAAPVLIIYSSDDGESSFVNKAWLDFTGRRLEEELGEGFADTFHPDFKVGVTQAYWKAFNARCSIVTRFPMLRHDGVYRWMEGRGTPRLRHDGGFAGFIGCLVDVTEQRELAQELAKQRLCTAAIAQAAGMSYQILNSAGWHEPAALAEILKTYQSLHGPESTFVPVISDDEELVAILALKPTSR